MTSAAGLRRPRRRVRLPSAWHLVLLPVALLMAIPLIWMLLTSVSTLAETRHFPPSLPSGLHWQNYTQAWNDSPMARWLINSAIVSFTCVVHASGFVARPIGADLVWDLYQRVRGHLDRVWWDPQSALTRGKVFDFR